MRSDSRLDFVAKSLAVAGLGALGLSAALLDRWTAEFPAVPSPIINVSAPAVQIALALDESGPATFAASPILRRVSETKRRAAKRDTPSPEISSAFTDVVVNDTPRQLPVPVESGPVAGSFVALSSLPPPLVETWQPMATPTAETTGPSDEGFFSGMLKRTGSSVGNSLGKASNSLVGAVRIVGDAVKRAF